MLGLWGMRSTPSLPSFPGPFRPGVIALDRVLSMDQIELNCILMLNQTKQNLRNLIPSMMTLTYYTCPVGWGCRIHRLLLCRGVRPPPMSVLDLTLNNLYGEVPVILELWGIRCTPSLLLLPGPLWPGMVSPELTAYLC